MTAAKATPLLAVACGVVRRGAARIVGFPKSENRRQGAGTDPGMGKVAGAGEASSERFAEHQRLTGAVADTPDGYARPICEHTFEEVNRCLAGNITQARDANIIGSAHSHAEGLV